MSDTPRTDQCQKASLQSGGSHSGQFKSALNIYSLAREMESGIGVALMTIDAQIEGNTGAASGDVSEVDKSWSLGVAEGLKIAKDAIRYFTQPDVHACEKCASSVMIWDAYCYSCKTPNPRYQGDTSNKPANTPKP